MITRKAFVWDVQLGSATGEVVETTLTNFWSPERIESTEIGDVAAAQYNAEHGTQLIPISAKVRETA